MLAPLPLSKIERWAWWIAESVGCYLCSHTQLKGSAQKSWWPNQVPVTFFSFQKEECWSSTTLSSLAGTQVDLPPCPEDKSACNYKSGFTVPFHTKLYSVLKASTLWLISRAFIFPLYSLIKLVFLITVFIIEGDKVIFYTHTVPDFWASESPPLCLLFCFAKYSLFDIILLRYNGVPIKCITIANKIFYTYMYTERYSLI